MWRASVCVYVCYGWLRVRPKPTVSLLTCIYFCQPTSTCSPASTKRTPIAHVWCDELVLLATDAPLLSIQDGLQPGFLLYVFLDMSNLTSTSVIQGASVANRSLHYGDLFISTVTNDDWPTFCEQKDGHQNNLETEISMKGQSVCLDKVRWKTASSHLLQLNEALFKDFLGKKIQMVAWSIRRHPSFLGWTAAPDVGPSKSFILRLCGRFFADKTHEPVIIKPSPFQTNLQPWSAKQLWL